MAAGVLLAALLGVEPGQPVSEGFGAGLEAYKAGDYATALGHWGPLAETGEARSQYAVGTLFLAGQGVPANPAEAARWFSLAALQDFPPAQFELGVLFAGGDGVAQSAKMAYVWFFLAAEGGVNQAKGHRDYIRTLLNADEETEARAIIEAWRAQHR